jgi:hypothetical protein
LIVNPTYSANPLLSNLPAPSDQKDVRIEKYLAAPADVEDQQKDSIF